MDGRSVVRVRRHKLNPFKLLCILLYGNHKFMTWDGRTGEIELGPLARLMRVSNSRLRGYLQWLAAWNYITDLQISRGRARLGLLLPSRFQAIREATIDPGGHSREAH